MGITKKNVESLGLELSMLGFGCMRFPIKDGKIDQARAEAMLDEAYKAGVNYFDTAYPYHEGESEGFTGKTLSRYPRNTYYVATKLPTWEVKNLDDAKRIFDLQRKKFDGEYVDFYLIHALNKNSWSQMRDLGVIEFLKDMKKEGKIKNLGFSFHDGYEVFEEIINYTDWDFCQIQYNYMDTEEQAGDRGYELTVKKNIPLVIMEPVKGGLLANLPKEAAEEFKKVNPDKSIASWALRWVSSHDNVKVVLSGMSDEEQVRDNLATYTDFSPLTDEEAEAVKKVADFLKARVNNGCTGCSYCMPCPAKVNIPLNFKMWNRYGIYANDGDAKWHWENEVKEENRADKCIKCGRCEQKCPQKLSIRDDLEKVKNTFDKICSS